MLVSSPGPEVLRHTRNLTLLQKCPHHHRSPSDQHMLREDQATMGTSATVTRKTSEKKTI